MAVTVSTWLEQAKKQLSAVDDAIVAEWLLSHYCQKPRAFFRNYPEIPLTKALLVQLDAAMQQLTTGMPLAYIIGYQDFWDMRLVVSPDTLIPRSDTEAVIDAVLNLYPQQTTSRFVDLGTGSGAIAIALSRELPHAHITATDCCAKALAIATANAVKWQRAPIELRQTSWLTGFAPQSMDCIVSNPPYIDADDAHLPALAHEPHHALVSDDNGLADIKTIIAQAETVLTQDGWLLLEHGYNQGEAVRALFGANWRAIKTQRDLAGHERVTMACNGK
ncbi:peptide chain release factor N(5)-glutamine methyltransferase [Ostreibacterium oceani]|uniref:Release factor glutamine methyltransferase n=1 Tax=Ostreibacterium oceani TaxID=2654998 RepID=A0A6N7ESM1_9GAMM|nr:peptide chain release factor N(5)-glutamine methyltransferase [Ostreibacterium oceani]MPV85541.1 peptide chain release factor N(5)-glutamine methyltransferase [Ostreibacterium oceani]